MKFDTTIFKTILTGHTSFGTAYKVESYPYGFNERTTLYAWIETVPKKGDRFVTQTVNPKTKRLNKPKASTYSDFMFMYLDDKGHVHQCSIRPYDQQEFETVTFPFLLERVGVANISYQQQLHLRAQYVIQKAISFGYDAIKYSEAAKPAHLAASKEAIAHMKTADFKDITKFPEMPLPDQPDAKHKVTITTFTI